MGARDGSRDRSESRIVKHQHSFSESGRSSVPMWDSSDPDRAPPPLPLNPGAASNSPLTKPYASSNIEKAAALIASRALENAPSSYTSNPPPSASPDRSLPKPQHRRMQSIQTGSVGRLSDSLERRSPDKGLSRAKFSELDDLRSSRSLERSPVRAESRASTPTKTEASVLTDSLTLDENIPPITNMIALQSVRSRQEAEKPLTDISNLSANSRPSMSLDSLSNQILHITSIATNLQREMTNLSRRSKDNATDLGSLREATNSRDEDIRKSLRDLVSSLDTKFSSIDSRILGSIDASRSTPNLGLYMDDPHLTPTRKTLNFARVTSPSLLDCDITASPSVVSVDGAASIALLEKVLREMGTKDGQEKIMTTLENVKAYADHKTTQAVAQNVRPAIDPEMMKKLEEILIFMKDMKEDSGSKALVRSNAGSLERTPSQMDIYLDRASQVAKVRQREDNRGSAAERSGTDVMGEDILGTLKSVKQSLSHNGGMTNEVKALIRELRGEVLGMGREIARKLDLTEAGPRGNTNADRGVTSEEVAEIVEQCLAELKEHMHHVVEESKRRSTQPEPVSFNTQEVYQTIQRALSETPSARGVDVRDFASERDEMIVAVKEAWEDCKPEIALEHFGLERDEILETIKEGLQSYESQQIRSVETTERLNQDIIDAVRTGLQDLQLPQISNAAVISREEILETIKECLESYNFPNYNASSQLTGSELSRDEIVDAVKEVLAVQISQSTTASVTKEDILGAIQQGLSAHSHVVKEVEFNREDLFDAIKACLEGDQNPLGGMGERVVEAMHEFLGSMKTEFQQYSAANGRDTEQVLDALKDGLEELRADVESYVDRAADVTGKDEIIDIVKGGFAALQADMDKGFGGRPQSATNTTEVLDAMDKEFEHIRETINKSLARANISSDKEEILDAIRDIADDKQSLMSGNSEDVMRLVKEELEHMRATLASTLVKNNTALDRDDVLDTIREGLESNRDIRRADGGESVLSNTSELLDAFQEGVDAIRNEMQGLAGRTDSHGANLELLDTMREGIESIRADIGRLNDKHFDGSDTATARGQEVMLHEGSNIASQFESLKVMITQLRIKVEALGDMPMQEPIIPSEMRMHKDDLADLHSAIRDVHDSVSNLPSQVSAPDMAMPLGAATKDDTDAIETLLRNVKARLDGISMPNIESMASADHLNTVEDLLREIKTSVESSTARSADSNKEDFTIVELLLKDVQTSIENMSSKIGNSVDEEGRLSRTDLQVLESICLETKERLESFTLPEIGNIASKEDLHEMQDTIKAFCERFEADNDLTAQAFEARKIEHGGLATKIDDVKTLIGDIREEFMSKLNGSEEGIVELAKVLGMHHDAMNAYATATSIAELSDLIGKGFQSQNEFHTTGKLETEERDATLFDKHEETAADLKLRIEEKFNELMAKYDDAQHANENKLSAINERDQSNIETITTVKAISDDLKNLLDTLGSTVSEACERMSTDSITVFEKISDTNVKLGDLHVANAHEHGMTRSELAKVLDAANRVEGTLHNHQPAILAAVQEVLGIVGQHFEHSQQYSEAFTATAEEIKSGVSAIPSAIPPLLPAPEVFRGSSSSSDAPPPEQYDDSVTQSKLDDLLAHTTSVQNAVDGLKEQHEDTQASLRDLDKLSELDQLKSLEKLDDIQKHVQATAEEITAMVATQTRLMAENHESKVTEAREAAIALEKRVAQKESVEAEIIALTQEKNQLAASMAALRLEHEEMIQQTKHLSREVGKLETALTIRQEEMRDMNVRAETLERRVLEGVMNHARSLRLAKPPPKKKISAAERDASMSLKRVPSTNSNSTTKAPSIKNGVSGLGSAVGMALKRRNPLGAAVNAVSSPRASVDRRILSTSHVTGSRPAEHARALVLAPSLGSRLANLKRSHSVKTRPIAHLGDVKPSWNGSESLMTDKENQEVEHQEQGDEISDSGTERRTSFTGTYAESMDYGTGSYVSRNSLRSVSYASSIGGTLNGQQDSILEDPDEVEAPLDQHIVESDQHDMDIEDDSHNDSAALVLANPGAGRRSPSLDAEMALIEAEDELADLPEHGQFQRHEAKYSMPSDSGIGSEPLTPDVSNQGSHLWKSTVST